MIDVYFRPKIEHSLCQIPQLAVVLCERVGNALLILACCVDISV